MTKEEYFERAVNAFGEDKLDESIEAYKQALSLDPNYQDALHGLGMAYFNHGRIDDAITTAKKLLEIDQDDILAHTSLSMFYQAQGRIEEAEKEGNAARILGWKQELRGNPGTGQKSSN
jgi:tetratricopeptide (TPR) repeat protein